MKWYDPLMSDNPYCLSLDCEQALHSAESREVAREPHVKGDASAWERSLAVCSESLQAGWSIFYGVVGLGRVGPTQRTHEYHTCPIL